MKSGTPPSVVEEQVGFQPPDENWRTHVLVMGTRQALNVYLFDLRENRKLRSNEKVRRPQKCLVIEEPAPARLDRYHLIIAWSAATEQQGRTTSAARPQAMVLQTQRNKRY